MHRQAAIASAILAVLTGVASGEVTWAPYTFGTVLRNTLTLAQYLDYKLDIPASAPALKVAVVPIYGDTDAYLSVNDAFEMPEDASWRMDKAGMEEMILRRTSPDFQCDPPPAKCELYVRLFGFSSSEFLFSVSNLTDPSIEDPANIECAPGCAHFDLTNNVCHEECNTTACLYDGGDCLMKEEYCTRGCPQTWIGDGICDEACYLDLCDWDGGDCFSDDWDDWEESEPVGCATGCLPSWQNDGQCDPECNVPQCKYDGTDCFFGHDECYFQPDGSDYRGNVNKTKSGLTCQAWSAQYPHQHTRSMSFYPWAGLGGHNYCRNPDGEDGPWCYTMDPDVRWELCDIKMDEDNCEESMAEPQTERGEVAPGPAGKCPPEMYLRVPGVCAGCTKCDNGLEERISCDTASNRVCAPACALDAANRFVAEGQGAIGVVQGLCGYDKWDHNASDKYASWDSAKLCGTHCCNAYGLAADACDYDGAHKDTWEQVKTALANAYEVVCPTLKVHDCRPIQVAMIESKGTKLANVTRILRARGNGTATRVTTAAAIKNPYVVTMLTALGASLLVLGLGLMWYRNRVKATLLYAQPNAPEEIQPEQE